MQNHKPSHFRWVEIGTDEFESVCEEINASGTRFGEIFRAAWTGEVGATGHETRRQYMQSYTVTLTLQPEDWRTLLATEEGH